MALPSRTGYCPQRLSVCDENSPVPILQRLDEALPPVWADGAQIRQVIHNLVQNAQDSLENTGARGAAGSIEVRTELAGDGHFEHLDPTSAAWRSVLEWLP